MEIFGNISMCFKKKKKRKTFDHDKDFVQTAFFNDNYFFFIEF